MGAALHLCIPPSRRLDPRISDPTTKEHTYPRLYQFPDNGHPDYYLAPKIARQLHQISYCQSNIEKAEG